MGGGGRGLKTGDDFGHKTSLGLLRPSKNIARVLGLTVRNDDSIRPERCSPGQEVADGGRPAVGLFLLGTR